MIQGLVNLDRSMPLASDLAGVTESKELAAAEKRNQDG